MYHLLLIRGRHPAIRAPSWLDSGPEQETHSGLGSAEHSDGLDSDGNVLLEKIQKGKNEKTFLFIESTVEHVQYILYQGNSSLSLWSTNSIGKSTTGITHCSDFVERQISTESQLLSSDSQVLDESQLLSSESQVLDDSQLLNGGRPHVALSEARESAVVVSGTKPSSEKVHSLLLLGVPSTISVPLLCLMLDLVQRDLTQIQHWVLDADRIREVRVLKPTYRQDDELLPSAYLDPNIDFYAVLFIFTSSRRLHDFYWKFRGAFFDKLMTTALAQYPKELLEHAFSVTSFGSPTVSLSSDQYLFGCCYFIHITSFSYATSSGSSRSHEQYPANTQTSAPMLLEVPNIPFPCYSVVPICPVCIERVDDSVFGIVTRSFGWTGVSPESKRCLASCRTCCHILIVQELLSMGVLTLCPSTKGQTQEPCASALPWEHRTNREQSVDSLVVEDPIDTHQHHPATEAADVSHTTILRTKSTERSRRLSQCLLLLGHATDCTDCADLTESWICLICAHLGCGRYKQKHAKEHSLKTHHRICLQVSSSHVWDYETDVFVHRRVIPIFHDGPVRRRVIGLPHPALSSAADTHSTASSHLMRRRRSEMQSKADAQSIRSFSSRQRRCPSPATNSSIPRLLESVESSRVYLVHRHRRSASTSTVDRLKETRSDDDVIRRRVVWDDDDDDEEERSGGEMMMGGECTDCLGLTSVSFSDQDEQMIVKKKSRKKKIGQNPLDEYCKKLEVILASQLEYQRTIHKKQCRELEVQHWNTLQGLLSAGDDVQAETMTLAKEIDAVKEMLSSQKEKNQKVETLLSAAAAEAKELKALNESLLLSSKEVIAPTAASSSASTYKPNNTTLSYQEEERRHEARNRVLDEQIKTLQDEVSKLLQCMASLS